MLAVQMDSPLPVQERIFYRTVHEEATFPGARQVSLI
jgi:hypothetical protein